jgi:anti-anti-sigma factor
MSAVALIETEQRAKSFVMRLRGEIDISNARELFAAIEAAVPNATSTIVVDLSEITYLDSAGVKLLIQLADRMKTRRRQLRLVVPEHSPIRAVLELTGLLRLIPTDFRLD